MNSKKSIKLPTIITLIFIVIIVYLFTNIKQSKVVCEKTTTYDSNMSVNETVISTIDGKKISNMIIQKVIILPETINRREEQLSLIKNSLAYTLEYLKDAVSYSIYDDRVVVDIQISRNDLVLLDNIDLSYNNGDVRVQIETNTKSNSVVALKIGDSYTDGELMKRLKNNGYACK